MRPIAAAVPLNAQYDGSSTREPRRQVATPTMTATRGPARIAASVIPMESRKIGSLMDCAIQATTRFRPTSVGMRTICAGFNDLWDRCGANFRVARRGVKRVRSSSFAGRKAFEARMTAEQDEKERTNVFGAQRGAAGRLTLSPKHIRSPFPPYSAVI